MTTPQSQSLEAHQCQTEHKQLRVFIFQQFSAEQFEPIGFWGLVAGVGVSLTNYTLFHSWTQQVWDVQLVFILALKYNTSIEYGRIIVHLY